MRALTSSSLVRAIEKFQGARLLNSNILASMHQLLIIVLTAQLFRVRINHFFNFLYSFRKKAIAVG